MRTTDGVSPIARGNVVWSLAMFGAFFALIGVSYLYFTVKTLKKGPDLSSPIPSVQRGAPETMRNDFSPTEEKNR